MSKKVPKNTHWVVTCPKCGAREVLIGFGRFRRKGPLGALEPQVVVERVPDGQDPVTEAARLRTKSRPCSTCLQLQDLDQQAERRAQMVPEMAAFMLDGLMERRDHVAALPIQARSCLYCDGQITANRSDALFCSPGCKQGWYRRIAVLKAGRLPSAVMNDHWNAARHLY